MGKLSKKQYEKRNENAAIRMEKNKDIEALTEEQHEALAELCKARHDFHSNFAQIVIRDENRIKDSLILVNQHIKESGLEPMSFIPDSTFDGDYIDIDTIDDLYDYLYEIGKKVKDEDYRDWYDSNYYRIWDELESLNNKIENYLREIDSIYGTNYSPTGAYRIF